MPTTKKRTISLPSELTAFIDAKVASGDYASTSEVVRTGLQALREQYEAVERWLRDEVAPAFDAMADDPSRGIPAESVFANIRARHTKRLRDLKR